MLKRILFSALFILFIFNNNLLASSIDSSYFSHLKAYDWQPISDVEKVESVKVLFDNSGASQATQQAVKEYTEKAFKVLETLNISVDKKKILRRFGEQLMNRHV